MSLLLRQLMWNNVKTVSSSNTEGRDTAGASPRCTCSHSDIAAPHGEVKPSVTDKHVHTNTHTLSQLHNSAKAIAWRHSQTTNTLHTVLIEADQSVVHVFVSFLLFGRSPAEPAAAPSPFLTNFTLFYIYFLLPAGNCCWASLTWQLAKKDQHETEWNREKKFMFVSVWFYAALMSQYASQSAARLKDLLFFIDSFNELWNKMIVKSHTPQAQVDYLLCPNNPKLEPVERWHFFACLMTRRIDDLAWVLLNDLGKKNLWGQYFKNIISA